MIPEQDPEVSSQAAWLAAPWAAPPNVHALFSTRIAGSFPESAALPAAMAAAPRWLRQVHGRAIVNAAVRHPEPPQADASFSIDAGVVCAVLTADCLPVLLAEARGRGVAAAHAGWRGLAAGVIQDTAAQLRRALGEPDAELLACLGPAIGPGHFEVGPEVLLAMQQRLPDAASAFVPGRPGRYLADLFTLARQALAQSGVNRIWGEIQCTYSTPERFFSFRREGQTGRQAAFIWMSMPGVAR
jgi:polyphenol oxidase